MAQSRVPLYLGLGLAGAGGYYLYQAGGSPKVAEKKFEHDLAKLGGSKEQEVKTEGKLYAKEAGAKLDDLVAQAKETTSKVDAKLEAYRNTAEKNIDQYSKEAKKDFNQAVDKFDKTVEEKAAQAKSGLSSWFGGK
ncbi:hypothetical protein LTR66_012190 [Elasticomyces elasticus]|nr:hypothetical protein LTR66_012190 [Elasticomyces elasticus]KAK4982548.1 hypothetical protein LTR50_007694 [Elasticomyces elasticus]KAK5002192.1 hypothetical protein LTR28_011726 [Elasticomyces elasticus]